MSSFVAAKPTATGEPFELEDSPEISDAAAESVPVFSELSVMNGRLYCCTLL